jgi:hypothetical protein
LGALRDELRSYPGESGRDEAGESSIVIPFVLSTAAGQLSFISTTMMFGTPIDITLSELAIELFFPADEATAAAFRR